MSDINVGWLGLGRLGLPCALALAKHAGVEVYGYDPHVDISKITNSYEPKLDEYLHDEDTLLTQVDTIEEVVRHSDVIFVAVQTPHATEYEGITPMPDDRRDFNYSFLKTACGHVARLAEAYGKHITLTVISTVLPGTMDREIRPLLNGYVNLAYNPFFIAMGTTIRDYLDPEFVLVGVDRAEYAQPLEKLYSSMHDKEIYVCSIPSAELVKVSYNTFISMKILFANTLMEICHKSAADLTEVLVALKSSTYRVVSSRYMDGGMGDGGACHPRDLIAMSWLSQQLDLSHDLFGDMVRGREDQTRWIAQVAAEAFETYKLDRIVILGKSYKSRSNLTFGSPALLLRHYLQTMIYGDEGFVIYNGLGNRINDKIIQWDPYVDEGDLPTSPGERYLYVIATDHPEFRRWEWEPGAVIVDPWRRVPHSSDRTVIWLGGKAG